MTRTPRPVIENAHYHVFNRGHSKQPIFLSEYHYELFLEILETAIEKFGFELLAYSLMKNHYHLQIITPNGNISKIMEYVGRVYAIKFNRDSGRLGPVWQSRFRSILVEKRSYLLHLNRYIHLNPVRAGYSDAVETYKWSSFGDYIWGRTRSIVTIQHVMNFFDKTDDFFKFTTSTIDTQFDRFYDLKRQPMIIGSDSFIERHR